MADATSRVIRIGGASAILLGSLGVMGSAQAYSAFSPDSPYMLGDWGGERTALEEAGVSFDFDYVGEAATILDGGYHDSHVSKYADQFAVGANFDLDRLLSIPNAEFQVTVTNRNVSLAIRRLTPLPNVISSPSRLPWTTRFSKRTSSSAGAFSIIVCV